MYYHAQSDVNVNILPLLAGGWTCPQKLWVAWRRVETIVAGRSSTPAGVGVTQSSFNGEGLAGEGRGSQGAAASICLSTEDVSRVWANAREVFAYHEGRNE